MITPTIHTLSNGLRVILVSMPATQSVSVLAMVKAGTKYEHIDQNGISHFLEHAVSKGTQAFPTAFDLALAIDKVGGKNNAYTGKEETGYYVKSASEHLETALKAVSEVVFRPTLPEADIEVERGVILEEIRMYEDDPQAKVSRVFEQVMFEPTSLGWPTLGTHESVSSITRQHLFEYHDYLYKPNRMVLVVAGGIGERIGRTRHPEQSEGSRRDKVAYGDPSVATLLQDDIVEKYFGEQKGEVKLPEEKMSWEQTKPVSHLIAKDTEQCHLVLGWRSFGRGHSDRYVLSVLSVILGGGMSSRLFMEIREKRGLAYYVGSYPQVYAEGGYLAMVAGTNPQTAQTVIDLATQEFLALTEKKVSEEELLKAKAIIKGHLVLGWEDSMEVAEFYGEDLLMEGKIRSREEVLAEIEAVSREDIIRVAKTIFVDQGKNLVAIGPEAFVGKLKV